MKRENPGTLEDMQNFDANHTPATPNAGDDPNPPTVPAGIPQLDATSKLP